MIAIENFEKVFKTESVRITPLIDINFRVGEGEFVAHVGPMPRKPAAIPRSTD